MQILLKLNCSLSEYYSKVKKGEFEFPSFKDRCGICKRPNCAREHGSYPRQAYDENYKLIPDLPIKRNICTTNQRKKKRKDNEHVTFSLLPECLSPYRRYSLKIMTYCLSIWIELRTNISKTLENIFNEIPNVEERLVELEVSHIREFINLFKSALTKYRIWKKLSTEYSLKRFIDNCSRYHLKQVEYLSVEYYDGNGKYIKYSQFLFGKASQFRSSA